MDYAVGRIMRILDDLDLAKNTIVIFSSDNGPVLDNGYQDGAVEMLQGHKPAGPLRGGKFSIYEGGTLIIRWSGKIKPGTVSDVLMSQVDFLASFAKLTQQKLNYNDARDSYDVLYALLGRSGQGRSTYVERSPYTLALISGNWKYIEPNGGHPRINKNTDIAWEMPEPQLYNLEKDMGEKNNLAEQYPGRVKKRAAALEEIKQGDGTRK